MNQNITSSFIKRIVKWISAVLVTLSMVCGAFVATSTAALADVPTKLTQAAAKGNAQAMFDIATIYNKGQGVERDNYEAYAWYVKAANAGHAQAQSIVGTAYMSQNRSRFLPKQKGKTNQEWSAFYMEKAAKVGDPDAQHTMGIYYAGGIGVTKSYQKSFYWYSMAAKQNAQMTAQYPLAVVQSQYETGLMYCTGKGTTKNIEEGKKWLLLAEKNSGKSFYRETRQKYCR